jgi:hypothetical protein
MLRLLKAEFQYYKISTFFFLATFLVVDITFVGWGYDVLDKSYPGIRAVMFLVMFGLLLMRQIKVQQEKMDRFYMKLPISLFYVSVLRILYLSIFWLVLLTIFWLNYLIFAFEYLDTFIIWDIISLSGLIFAAIAIPLLHRDLNNLFLGKNQKLIVSSVYGLALVFGYLFLLLFFIAEDSSSTLEGLLFYKEIISIITSVGTGPFIILLSGSGLLYLSTVIFKKRKLYLD